MWGVSAPVSGPGRERVGGFKENRGVTAAETISFSVREQKAHLTFQKRSDS